MAGVVGIVRVFSCNFGRAAFAGSVTLLHWPVQGADARVVAFSRYTLVHTRGSCRAQLGIPFHVKHTCGARCLKGPGLVQDHLTFDSPRPSMTCIRSRGPGFQKTQ